MSLKNKNLLFYICIFLLSALFILFVMYLRKGCILAGDDAMYSIYMPNESIFGCLFGPERFEHCGYYLGTFLCKLVCFGLPNLLLIHPEDFITYGAGFVNGIFTVAALYVITLFSVFKTKSKMITLSVFFFLGCFFFYNALQCSILWINAHYYRYFFGLIFYGIFWLYIFKNIILPSAAPVPETRYIFRKIFTDIGHNSVISVLKIFLAALCGFIVGTSIEINLYVSVSLIFLLIFYNIITDILFFITKNKDLILNKYNLGAEFYIPAAGLLTGIVLSVASPGSIDIAKHRGMDNIHITADIFKEYFLLYIKRFFIQEPLYWCLFIILMCICFYFAYKRKKYKELIFPLFMQLSILVVFFSLILCGKTGYNNDFWIDSHVNIIFLYKMLIIFPALLYFSELSEIFLKLPQSKFKIFICTVFAVIVTASGGYILKSIDTDSYIKTINIYSENRKMTYIIEKIMRFHILRNEEKIILPLHPEYMYTVYPYFFILAENKKYILDDYNYRVYKDEQPHEYIFINAETACNDFLAKGGTFSVYELENIKFSRLFDNEFVLNQNK